MKFLKIALAALFLMAFVFASLAFAQQKPAAGAAPAQQMTGIMMMQVKPGMGLEWENYMKNQLIPAAKKGGMKQLGAWKTKEFGIGDRYIFTWPIASLAELDGPDPFEKSLGPDGAIMLLANIQRCVEGVRTFMLSEMPDLSIAPKPGYVPKFGVLVTVTVAPGRTDEYEKTAKEMQGVMAKTNAKAYLIGKVFLGGNPNQYLTSVALDNFADLATFGQLFVKAMTESKMSLQPGVTTNILYEVYAAIPELSIQ